MLTSLPTPDVLVRATANTGEGPVLDPRSGELAWVDIPGGVLHISDVGSGADRTTSFPTMLGAVAPRLGPGWAAAVAEGFALIADDLMSIIDPILPEPNRRMNDAKCDPAGRMWAGSATLNFDTGTGALHRWDGRGPSVVIRTGLTLPNGIGWSPDGRTMYIADSMVGVLYRAAFDPGSGELGRLEPFYHVEHGLPDGLCVAEDGSIWLALWGAGRLERISTNGQLLQKLPMPVSQVSSCALHPDGTLFITSARGGLDGRQLTEQPLAGSVFAAAVGVGPVPIASFAA